MTGSQRGRPVRSVVPRERADRAERKRDVGAVLDLQELVHDRRRVLPVRRAALQHELRVVDVRRHRGQAESVHTQLHQGRSRGVR